MERKAVRSPSLRLRFGRRSDPDFPLRNVSRRRLNALEFLLNWNFHLQYNEIENEVEQKPIRSPSLRLRFGRRSDPLMSLFNEVKFDFIESLEICVSKFLFHSLPDVSSKLLFRWTTKKKSSKGSISASTFRTIRSHATRKWGNWGDFWLSEANAYYISTF